ncbi:MAG: SRPBCC family protein, partial [Candidatus Limnocylindrales bacterium]
IEIGAPIERVWLRLAEVERQPEWMVDLKWVRIETPGPIRVGSRASALVRIMGIGVADPVEVIEFVPPHAYAVRHEGHFQGSGVFHLEALEGNGGRTRVTWDETLIPPILPNLLGLILAPILGRVFRADLERLRDQLEIEMVTVGR